MNQEWKTRFVQKITTITSFKMSMEFSIIRFYSKATAIQETHDKNRI